MTLLAMSMDPLSSWQPSPLPPSARPTWPCFLNVTLGCAWNASTWTRGMPFLMEAFEFASLPALLRLHPTSRLPLYVKVPPPSGFPLLANTTRTRTLLFPLEDVVEMQVEVTTMVEMSTQLGLVESPLSCASAPQLTLVPSPAVGDSAVVALVYVEVQVPTFDSFLAHWVHLAVVSTLEYIGLSADDIQLIQVDVLNDVLNATTVQVSFDVSCVTQAQVDGVGVLLSSPRWLIQLERWVLTPHINTSEVRWLVSPPPPPSISLPPSDTFGCDVHTTFFRRPLKKSEYLALTSDSNDVARPSVHIQLSAPDFAQNAFYLDHMTYHSPVHMYLNDVDPVAPIVSAAATSFWTFYTPLGVFDSLQLCLHLHQVYSSANTTPVTLCVNSVADAQAIQVSVNVRPPHSIAATYQLVGLSTVVLTLRNPPAIPTNQLVPVHPVCVACQEHFERCRNQRICRDLVMQCLHAHISTSGGGGGGPSVPYGSSYFEELAADPSFIGVSIQPELDTCLQASLETAANASMAVDYVGNAYDQDKSAMTREVYAAWGVYVRGLQCIAVNQCPMGTLALPQTTSIYPSLELYPSIVQDILSNVQLPTTVHFKSPWTSETTPFSLLSTATQNDLIAFILSTYYADSEVVPTLELGFYPGNNTSPITTSVVLSYTLSPCQPPPPTLLQATRIISTPANTVIVPTTSWPKAAADSAHSPLFEYMTSLGVCPAYDLTAPLQITPSLAYLGNINTTLEPDIPRVLSAFFVRHLSTCVGSISGAHVQMEIDSVLQDRRCAAWFAFDWAGVRWNASDRMADEYTTRVCPMYATARPCFHETLLPALDRLIDQSGGCCDDFVAEMQAQFGQAPTSFVAAGVSKWMDVLCSATSCDNVTTVTTCGARALRQLASPWIEHALQAFQIKSSEACAAVMGQPVASISGALYDATCPLGGCAQYWDIFLSWIQSFPILNTYPTDGFLLSDLFQDDGVDGPLLLGFWNDMMLRWHATGIQWPLLQTWTSWFYSNVDYMHSNWLVGRKFHISTNFTSGCAFDSDVSVTLSASQWQCISPPLTPSFMLVRVVDRLTIHCYTGSSSSSLCTTYADVDTCYNDTVLPNVTSLYMCDTASLANPWSWCGYTQRLVDRTTWHCVSTPPNSTTGLPSIVAVRMNSDDVECLRQGVTQCQEFASMAACELATQPYTPLSQQNQTLRCGVSIVQYLGHPGYFQPSHWCALAASYFGLTLSTTWPPWHCIAHVGDDVLAARVNKDNDVECWSSNRHDCAWFPSMAACQAAKDDAAAALQVAPLSCGRVHSIMWNTPGYADPGHWCAKVATRWQLQLYATPFVCAPVANPPVTVYAVRRNGRRDVECYAGDSVDDDQVDGEGCYAFQSVEQCTSRMNVQRMEEVPVTMCDSYATLSQWCVTAQQTIDAPSYDNPPPVGRWNATRVLPVSHNATSHWIDLNDWHTAAFAYGWYDGVFWRFMGDLYQGTSMPSSTPSPSETYPADGRRLDEAPPDSTPAPTSDSPDSTPAPTSDSPDSTPAPTSDSSDSTPAPTSDSPDSTPAPTSDSPDSTPAPASDSSDSTPAPTSDSPDSTPAPTTFAVPASVDWGWEKTRCLLHLPSVGTLFCRGVDSAWEWNAVMACISFDAATGDIVDPLAYYGDLGLWYQYVY
ncbi:hypothetical protein, variant 1 [Aphanomyces astaci]|nr:hypothetical protein, variant 1 [Aphanomyces astaci]ETV79695.1 hypothetical protein, variant 1 [Aphanomyces astaci]|eukprot:XP_009830631.1 hypothetical protein, variant 1 [Aphanomyces astaci]